MKLPGVTEYNEEMPVELTITDGTYPDKRGKGRMVIRAFNEGGCNCVDIDLRQMLLAISKTHPEIYKEFS